MPIGVIGTINRDTVIFADGTRRLGWGGILYNIRTLSKLLGKDDVVVPACHVGADCHAPIMLELKRLKNVWTDAVNKVPHKNNHCQLTYNSLSEKHEILDGGVPRLYFDDLKPLTDCRIVLINFISGSDLFIPSLSKFRNNFSGLIYTDIHSYTLGRSKDGSRFLRTPPAWDKVVACTDYLQMNRLELAVLIDNDYQMGLSAPVEDGLKTMLDLYKEKHEEDRKLVVIVTEGSAGGHIFDCLLANGTWEFYTYKYEARAIDGDTTGCGDCFAAGYVSGLARNYNVANCLDLARGAAEECIRENEKWRNSGY